MRYRGIIILGFLIGCKATQPSSSPSYSEDLSVLRPQKEVIIQTDTTNPVASFTPLEGHIKAELDSIVRYSIAKNQEGKLVNGFVIQVYTGNNRDRANAIRRKMDDYFPELSPKISYYQPNFRVKAGQFTDRLEAHRVFKDVKEEFPKALLIPERFTFEYERTE